jgi:hypothetical protein
MSLDASVEEGADRSAATLLPSAAEGVRLVYEVMQRSSGEWLLAVDSLVEELGLAVRPDSDVGAEIPVDSALAHRSTLASFGHRVTIQVSAS